MTCIRQSQDQRHPVLDNLCFTDDLELLSQTSQGMH